MCLILGQMQSYISQLGIYSQVLGMYKHLKKGAYQNHLDRQKMNWFLAD